MDLARGGVAGDWRRRSVVFSIGVEALVLSIGVGATVCVDRYMLVELRKVFLSESLMILQLNLRFLQNLMHIMKIWLLSLR